MSGRRARRARHVGPRRLRATHVEGDEAWLLHDAGDLWLAHGDEESGLGWYAPTYGTLAPAWTARVTHQTAAPFAIVTWMGAARTPAHDPPSMARVIPTGDPGGAAIGVRVVTGHRTAVFLLQPGGPRPPATRACGIADYQTDARALHYLDAGGHLTRLDLVGASHARTGRDGWLSLEASEAMTDLHVTVQDGVLDLQASRPPAHLRLQGGVVGAARAVRLNHRALPPTAHRADVLLVEGVEWAEGRST